MYTKESLKIVFFGTPDFAVASLKTIIQNGFNIVAVVTAPDKPAGRGYVLQQSAVKKYADEQGLKVLQPTNLKAEDFIMTLKDLNADLQIVIAFRMLPEVVWNMPPLGTFNLHASFLPEYRGAAPINRAIMNGEKQTGVTTFFLKHEIDTGSIILQQRTNILPEDNAGSLHDKLMNQGAALVVSSLHLICDGNYQLKEQMQGNYPHAPKIFTEDCKIDWNRKAAEIHDMVRGLSPFPAAFTTIDGKKLKIFSTLLTKEIANLPGQIEVKDKQLLIHCMDQKLIITEVQPEGKKRMNVSDFVNGFKITEQVIAQ